MADLKRELTWSTYQDKQLKILQSLERSFDSSLRTSKSIEDSMTKVRSSMETMVSANTSLVKHISSLYDRMTGPTKAFRDSTISASSSLDNFSGKVKDTGLYIQGLGETAINIAASAEETRRKAEEALRQAEENKRRSDSMKSSLEDYEKSYSDSKNKNRFSNKENSQIQDYLSQVSTIIADNSKSLDDKESEIQEIYSKIGDMSVKADKRADAMSELLSTIGRKLLDFLEDVARIADDYSDKSNTLIAVSGASGSLVRGARGSIVHDITSDLNADTGNFYNPQEVYGKMIAYASEAGIGNLDTLKELTRPIMLAQESMDINIGELTTLLGRWSTRYNFSSTAMEEIVNDIRSSTAGNQATAEATMQNLTKLENYIAAYSKGNESKMNSMVESLSNGTAWLENMGVGSDRYTQYLTDIASGDFNTNTMLLSVLNAAGLSNSEASKLFAEGNLDTLYEKLYQGELALSKSLDIEGLTEGNTSAFSAAAKALGLDPDSLFNVYASSIGENYTSLEDFIAGMSDATAAETVEDKYITATDKINNWLSQIYEVVADGQEATEIGLGDILKFLTMTFGVIKMVDIVKSVATLSAGQGTASTILAGIGKVLGVSGSGLAGVASAASVALPVAAAVVAVVSAVLSIQDLYKEVNKKDLEGYDAVNTWIEGSGSPSASKKVTVENGKATVSYDYNSGSDSPEEILSKLAEAKKQELEDVDSIDNLKWYDWVLDIITLGLWGEGKSLITHNAIDDKYKLLEDWANFLNDLDDEGMKLTKAYQDVGLLNDTDAQKFYTNNYEKILEYSKEGKAVSEMSRNGLNTKNLVDRKLLLGYATGTNYIDRDQIAVLHEGEAVVPKRYNPMANITELEALREQYKRDNNQEEETSNSYMKTLISEMAEIKEFLSYWREDNIKRENANSQRNRFDSNRQYLSRYLT